MNDAGAGPPADLPPPPAAAGADVHLSPLSIQAAALVRSMDALSNIFWVSIGGTVLTIFFVGLNELHTNAVSDSIALGEYEVPKAILPLAALSFALFAFWMTANRLAMLAHVLESTRLPRAMVHEIFHLNPPVLHIFDRNNAHSWSPLTGISVLLLNWAVFFGNSAALTLAVAVQEIALFARFDWETLSLFAVFNVGVIAYGVRAILPPLRVILERLHDAPMVIGWTRWALAVTVMVAVVMLGNFDRVDIDDQPDDLIGPSIANAIDGETLFMQGIEVNLFGIDAMERDQTCQDASGADYPCGREAVQALQRLVEQAEVVCLPFFAVSPTRVVGACERVKAGATGRVTAEDFTRGYREESLSRRMVELGHALTIGFGAEVFGEEQRQAQILRVGIWRGSFEPPANWRARQAR